VDKIRIVGYIFWTGTTHCAPCHLFINTIYQHFFGTSLTVVCYKHQARGKPEPEGWQKKGCSQSNTVHYRGAFFFVFKSSFFRVVSLQAHQNNWQKNAQTMQKQASKVTIAGFGHPRGEIKNSEHKEEGS